MHEAQLWSQLSGSLKGKYFSVSYDVIGSLVLRNKGIMLDISINNLFLHTGIMKSHSIHPNPILKN